MAISKKIIEKHNGKLWAHSDGIGKGSEIYFTLPNEKNENPKNTTNNPWDNIHTAVDNLLNKK